MPQASVAARIQHYNRNREPERLALKYAAMRRSALGFLRGTSHLFHEDWPTGGALDQTPLAWITGDLHVENFGTYKGDNRLGYFDLNDFDEATLAPCGRDLARFHTSVLLVAKSAGVNARDATTLVKRFVAAYRVALKEGKARWLERQTADGMVGQLLEDVRHLTRKRLLDRRTIRAGGSRRLRIGKRALPVTADDRHRVERIIDQFATGRPDPAFYRVLDVARRVAGTASLGLERWVVLVDGHGAPDKLALLDLKQAIPPSMRPFADTSVDWPSEAERVVSVQRWVQAVPPALLHPVRSGGRSFVLRELQPTQHRLSLDKWNGKLAPLEGIMVTMGQAVAWSHLRSGGRQGSAIADQWIAFAEDKGWAPALHEFASSYSRRVERDWQEFSEADDVLPRDLKG